jgi:hypothetical protein
MLLVQAETRCLSPGRKNDHGSTNETILENGSKQKEQEKSKSKILKFYPRVQR